MMKEKYRFIPAIELMHPAVGLCLSYPLMQKHFHWTKKSETPLSSEWDIKNLKPFFKEKRDRVLIHFLKTYIWHVAWDTWIVNKWTQDWNCQKVFYHFMGSLQDEFFLWPQTSFHFAASLKIKLKLSSCSGKLMMIMTMNNWLSLLLETLLLFNNTSNSLNVLWVCEQCCLSVWLLLRRSDDVVLSWLVIAKRSCSRRCFSFVPVSMTNHSAGFRPALLRWDTSHLGNKLAWLLSWLLLKWLSVMSRLRRQREHFNNLTWALENILSTPLTCSPLHPLMIISSLLPCCLSVGLPPPLPPV